MASLDEIREEAYQKEIERLRSALTEIRDVARISEGVGWYAMIADRALKGSDVQQITDGDT